MFYIRGLSKTLNKKGITHCKLMEFCDGIILPSSPFVS